MLCVRDRLGYTALTVKGDVVENFWVRTSTETNETNIVRVLPKTTLPAR